MDEMNMPEVDNTNVVISEPAYTGSAPRPQAPVEAPVEEPAVIEKEEDEPSTTTESTVPEPKVEAPAEEIQTPIEPKTQMIDVERLNKLRDTGTYKPADAELDILDEYGNLDSKKFGEFMVANNENVFNQALNAFNSKTEAVEIENNAWEAVNKEYPELKDNPTLEKAIRGARIQDIINNGTGDLLEIAKGIVGPIRENKIKAVEEVNRTVKKQEDLSTFKPNNAPVEQAPVSLMSRLRNAVSSGDTQLANQIRHAIRVERIYGKNDTET